MIFRGKTKFGEWLYWDEYGYMRDKDGKPKVYYVDMSRVVYVDTAKRYIIPETFSACSGVPDKNGVMMYEGDVVKGRFRFGLEINSVVKFRDGAFGLESGTGNAARFTAFTSMCNIVYEVVGNIHDSPELMD